MGNNEDLIKTKIGLLVWGVKPTKETIEFLKEQNPYTIKRTGNYGLHMLLGNKFPVLVSTTHRFNKKSPFELKKHGTWFIEINGTRLADVGIIKMPKWYQLKCSDGTPMTEIFIHEGFNSIHILYEGCGYFATKEQCKFCSSGPKFIVHKPENIAEVVKAAYNENPKYEVCLSGGTTLGPDKGALYHIKNIKAIRKLVPTVPIFAEMAPPDDNSYIDQLVEAGITSIGYDIEIWDDDIRKKTCPGKSKISKQRYLDSMKYALEKLGKNKVCCVIIIGLQPESAVLEGVETLCKLGVKPILMPFKPFDGAEYDNQDPPSIDECMSLMKKAAVLMKKHGMKPHDNPGCTNCGACSC
jgi:radical SAM protein (TIGR04043 family)